VPKVGYAGSSGHDNRRVFGLGSASKVSLADQARYSQKGAGAVLDWTYASGYREREAPMRAIANGLLRQPKKGNHLAVMLYGRVAAFIAKLCKRESFSRLALQFAILSAARSGEVRGTTWDGIGMKAGLWTLSKLLKELGDPYAVHGLRSAFRGWVSEETNYVGDVAEAPLAHAIGN
jgi:integrase